MTTKIYGCSDDLIEFKGDISGEVGNWGTDKDEHGVLLIFNDGTILEIKYGKADMGIWGIMLLNSGSLLDHIDSCIDEDTDPYSDVAYFKDGLKWAYAAADWQRVK